MHQSTFITHLTELGKTERKYSFFGGPVAENTANDAGGIGKAYPYDAVGISEYSYT